jgi:hypothetical protein
MYESQLWRASDARSWYVLILLKPIIVAEVLCSQNPGFSLIFGSGHHLLCQRSIAKFVFAMILAPVKIGLHGVIVTYRESRRAGLWKFK